MPAPCSATLPACVRMPAGCRGGHLGHAALPCWGATRVSAWQPVTLPPADLDLTVRVLLYTLIFVLSVCGNALVVAVLLLNRRLRTVTNSFLLSLALSDLMLAICCMPFTLIPNLMGTFIFGEAVCKLMAYLMGTRGWQAGAGRGLSPCVPLHTLWTLTLAACRHLRLGLHLQPGGHRHRAV